MSLRVPASAEPAAKALADRAFQRVVDVLEERVGFQQAGHVLKAATIIREEVCGPLAQKLEHSGPDGQALSITIDLGAGK
ncbi:hypothetical protein [Corallococcus sp. CA047B]|uniref:hypothetical protein n=1 Tax=Corallococcus sp. CA047B TaxID=2316729 RepID=UPI0018F44CBF|nr:hypothetical protein [Corallococcus sp. CA047B]